jgi:hypothetical protein
MAGFLFMNESAAQDLNSPRLIVARFHEPGVEYARFERTWRQLNQVWTNLVNSGPGSAEPGVGLLEAARRKLHVCGHLYPYFIAEERPHEGQSLEKFGP